MVNQRFCISWGGLIKPDFGSVYLDGLDISILNDDESSRMRNKDIGFVFQSFFLELEFSVYENIELPLIISKKKNYNEHINELLDKFGLTELKNHKVLNLSGGEKQRVAIARALVNNPRVLLCDEPTGNLDKSNGDIVFSYLREIADSGVLVIFVTHDNEYAKIADVTLRLEGGVISEIN